MVHLETTPFSSTPLASTPKTDVTTHSQLDRAIHEGNLYQIQALFDTPGPQIDLSKPLNTGQLPLGAAIRLGHSVIVAYLVQKGANPMQVDPQGLTAIDYAALSQNKDLLSILLPKDVTEAAHEASIEAQKFEFADPANVKRTQVQIQELRQLLVKSITLDPKSTRPLDKLNLAIFNEDVSAIRDLTAQGHVVSNENLLFALFSDKSTSLSTLLEKFDGDINAQLGKLPFNLLHVAAHLRNTEILQQLVKHAGNLYLEDIAQVKPADLLFDHASKRDPLRLKRAQLALTILTATSLVLDLFIQPNVSFENFYKLQGLLMLVHLANDFAVSYNVYNILNPQGFLKKAAFWAQTLLVLPLHSGLSYFPTIKCAWDIYRVGRTAYTCLSDLKRASSEYTYDKAKSLKYAALQMATLASTSYQCRASLGKVVYSLANTYTRISETVSDTLRATADSVSSYIKSPTVEDPKPPAPDLPPQCPVNQAYGEHLDDFSRLVGSNKQESFAEMTSPLEAKSCKFNLDDAVDLQKRVDRVLENGGKLVRIPSSAGVYFVKDSSDKTIAIFKPDSERNWGPECPNPAHRKPDPTASQMFRDKLSSFEQGRPGFKQDLAKRLDFSNLACIPIGTPAHLRGTQFIDLTAIGNPCAKPREQLKYGYLQAWVENSTPLADLHPDAEAGKPAPANAYDFASHTVLDQVPIEEFQKVGLLELLTYHEDHHPGNILVKYDTPGNPHLIPIDFDSIFPFKLDALMGVFGHKRASEPFSPKSLQMIADLDTDAMLSVAVAQSPHYPSSKDMTFQVENLQALILTIKAFAKEGKTLADIFKFVSNANPGKHRSEPGSSLWQLLNRVKAGNSDCQEALQQPSPGEFAESILQRCYKWESDIGPLGAQNKIDPIKYSEYMKGVYSKDALKARASGTQGDSLAMKVERGFVMQVKEALAAYLKYG